MSAHTPTPWMVSDKHSDLIIRPIKSLVASVNRGMAKQEMEANAAFIVRACNAHAQLVAAMEELVADGLRRDGLHSYRFDAARQALAAAKGQP